MKIKDLINNLDRSEANKVDVDLDELACQFNLYSNFNFDYDQTRLTAYWVSSWICTDTWVGYKVYYFDDIPVAFSTQTARKSPEDIQWLSKDAYRKVKDYISSFTQEDSTVSLLNLEEEIPDTFKIYFASEWIGKNEALLENKPVKVLRRENFQGRSNKVVILLDCVEKSVDIRDLDFKYNLKGYYDK